MIGKTEAEDWKYPLELNYTLWGQAIVWDELENFGKIGVQFDVINVIHVNSLIPQVMST